MSKISARDITMTAVFAAMAVVAAMLTRYAGPVVPFSLMPFVMMLAGSLLGPRLGSLSIIVYIMLGLVGIPVFATPPFGGPSYVFQPTFGFLLGFVCSAYVIGLLLQNPEKRSYAHYGTAMLAGILVYNLVALPYLYVILTFYVGQTVSVLDILKIGFIPFIALDLIKAAGASVLARAVYRRLEAYGVNRA